MAHPIHTVATGAKRSALTRCKSANYFKGQYYHLKPRLGANRAIVAGHTACSLRSTTYSEQPSTLKISAAATSMTATKEAAIQQAVRCLERLGKGVVLLPDRLNPRLFGAGVSLRPIMV